MQVTEPLDERLLELAKIAASKAYAPYSNFKVGAALLASSGEVYTGANVENGSYGLSICAERVVVTKAVSSGELKIKKIAVVRENGEGVFPCGACRQVIWEFDDGTQVITVKEGRLIKVSINELLPEAFRLR